MLLAETKGRVWKHRDSNLSFHEAEGCKLVYFKNNDPRHR